MALSAQISRGPLRGTALYPHRHDDGMYVVSLTRYERDYVRVASLSEVERGVDMGFRVRMSNPAAGVCAPSLIAPASIQR